MNNLAGRKGEVFPLRLSNQALSQLRMIAEKHQLKPDEVVRLGISLAKVALEARERGHKLVVATQLGVPLKDVLLPT